MKKLRLLFFTFIILLTLTITALFAYYIAEPKAYDFLIKNVLVQKLSFDKYKSVHGHDDVVLVIVDDKSIEKYRWPWKRDLNNKILKYFKEYTDIKVLVQDQVIFTLDIDNPDADKRFFSTIKAFDNLIEGFVYKFQLYENREQGKEYDDYVLPKYKIRNVEVQTRLPNIYKSMKMMPRPYIDSVKNLGSVVAMPGFFDGNWSIRLGDETFRTYEYVINYNGNVLPSLAMETFLEVNKDPNMVINKDSINFPDLDYKIRYIKTPIQLIVPLKFYKLYDGYYSHKKYSAVDILNSYDLIKQGKKPIIDPSEFKDKIVVYGAYATAGNGLNDCKKTPVAINQSGADLQATAVDNIFHKDFLNVIPNKINILIVIFCMLSVFYCVKTKSLEKAINYSLLIMFLMIMVSLVCYYFDVIIWVATPIIMCIYTLTLAYINRYLIESKNKEKVKSAMGKYMSEDVMKDVIKNIDNLGLGGKKAVVTVLFSDIRGFTSMSEKMSAQDVSQLLNEYFSEMEPIVRKYNGIINKFIGDAVMAVFGEPIQDEKHPENAVKCGYEMLKRVEELDEKWLREGKPVIKIGVGINTGEVFVGNIGSEKRMEYTVIGDTVNLASRLESYNKTYNTQILISSATYEACKDIIDAKIINDVEIRGKSQKLNIYEVKNINNLD